MALATLSIDLEARLAKLQAGLDQAGRMVEKSAAAIQAKWDAMQKSAAALGAAVGGAFSITVVSEFIRSNADAVDALNDVVDATGSTVESISALEAIALRTGDDLNLVSDILVKFNGVLKEADGKNSVSQALEAIGLNAKELRQLDPAEALRQVAVALSKYSDDGNKARLIQELFGKSAKEAAHFLHDLADAGQLVATTTAEQAKRAEDFNKALAALRTEVTLAARNITTEMLPALTTLAQRFNDALDSGDGFLEKMAIFAMPGRGSAKDAAVVLSQVTDEITQLQAAIAKDPGEGIFGSSTKALAEARLASLQKQAAILQRVVAAANDAAGQTDSTELARRGRGATETLPDYFGTTPKTPKVKTPKEDLVGPVFPESYTKALQALEQTDTVKLRDLREELTYLVSLKTSGSKKAGIDEAIIDLEEAIQKLDPAVVQLKAANAAVDALLGGDPEQLRKINDMLDVLRQRYQDGSISTKEFERASKSLYDQLDQLGPEVKKTADDMSVFWDQAMRNIQDSTSGFLVDAMQGDFAKIESSFVAMLDRMVAEALAKKLNKYLFDEGGIEQSISKIAGMVSGLFGGMSTDAAAKTASAIGGKDVLGNFLNLTGLTGGSGGGLLSTIGAFFGMGLANGGPAQAGGIHPVVERNQPEMLNIGADSYLLMPQRAGFVTPLQPARSSRADVRGGILNLTQNITTPPGTSRATQDQMGSRAYSASVRAFGRKG